jgi:hypothetical protein
MWGHRPLSPALSPLLPPLLVVSSDESLESGGSAVRGWTPSRPRDASDLPPTFGRGDFSALSASDTTPSLLLFTIAPVAWKLRNSKNEWSESLTPLEKENKQGQEP